jgi:hypothetical protein
MGRNTHRSGGIGGIQFHPVPYLFSRTIPRNNILIGDDVVQIRFVEQLTGLKCEMLDSVSDDDLFGKDGVLYRLLTHKGLALSPQVQGKTGVWALSPITAGSAGANALVKVAAGISQATPTKEQADALSRHIGKLFERNEISDLRVGLWETVWAMTADLPHTHWSEPWETPMPQDWMPPGMDLGLRFGFLFKTLKAYVLLHTNAEQEARKMGIQPHRLMKLKDLKLDPEKVYGSLKALSSWKHFDTDHRIVALDLTRVWLS